MMKFVRAEAWPDACAGASGTIAATSAAIANVHLRILGLIVGLTLARMTGGFVPRTSDRAGNPSEE
jgi:hypothetical protein